MRKHCPIPSAFKLSATGLAALALFSVTTEAALIVYEGFDYGGSNVALNSVSGSATGLAGTSYAGSGSYVSTGLAFGNLETTGGNVSFGNSATFASGYRQLATGTLAGTIYGSYIFQQTVSNGFNDQNAVGFGSLTPSITTDNTSDLLFRTDSWTNSATADVAASIRSDPDNNGTTAAYVASGSVIAPEPSTTVRLALFQITNLGATSGTQQVTLWILNEDQFANFKLGGLTNTELNAATIGTGAANVFERVTLSINGATGYLGLDNTNYLMVGNMRSTVAYDEIRLSNFSLDEVTPIPEPSAVALLGFCGLAMTLFRFRQGKSII